MVARRFTTPQIMWIVAASLLPGLAISTYFFGFSILYGCCAAVLSCVFTESLLARDARVCLDGSAVITGLIIGLCLPPFVPMLLVVLASVVAIALGKAIFGKLGQNLFNPAMLGYALVLVAFPESMTHYDAVTGATALDILSHRGGSTVAEASQAVAFGNYGAYGYEFINATFLVTGVVLVLLRIVKWILPLGLIAGFAIPATIFFDGGSSSSLGSPIFHLFAGGTMLAAFYVVTDPVTAPRTRLGQFLFAFSIGVFALVVRTYGAWPDGLAFGVLLGNALVPLLDKLPSPMKRSVEG